MLTTKQQLIDDLLYNNSFNYRLLGTQTLTQTNDHNHLINFDTSDSTQKPFVQEQDEKKREKLKILPFHDNHSFQNDNSFETFCQIQQEEQLYQNNDETVFTDNSSYNQYQIIDESVYFQYEENIKIQQNEQFQMQQNTHQAKEFEHNDFYPKHTNQVQQQINLNQFDYQINSEMDLEVNEVLFDQEPYQQVDQNQFQILNMNQQVYINNNLIPINFNKTQDQIITIQTLIDSFKTLQLCQNEQIQSMQLTQHQQQGNQNTYSQLENNQQQLEQKQEIQNIETLPQQAAPIEKKKKKKQSVKLTWRDQVLRNKKYCKLHFQVYITKNK
ncbi:hypothetical protein TTHERM_00463220 (macronuclear) [Tetrahymena thermophila SB210]|uniref:Uncharacterized protein n=1 Tax=Tetrahymena thermophila (strain SB210) TaxID=312017 RepID=Q23PW1_TETTS|nr:hypothetical protein TTHERM_00463220 [Tetrahymena thermophila SB210]EAR98574.1 hypothetical protein TTHERM_00463220 [Tetrahymena thermophila SB210]|eukprot:XP_001018819.1 hypothetical protein TTHERM_00463220 [Tetrahymena thermophila SB210]